MTIQIEEYAPGYGLSTFLRVPHLVLGNDPQWVPPLDMMVKDQLTPGKNPFLAHADVALFVAFRNGKPVGRISAQIDREHLRRYDDATGFFGFFDTIDDPAVAQGLMDRAREWLRARGMKRIRGPLSLSINEEVGMLVEGFDTPNMVYMPHHTPYQGTLAEGTGLTKAKDLYAYRWEMGTLPKRAQRAHEQVMGYPEVRLRDVNLATELPSLIEIQDDAWGDNWGHVSMTEAEASQLTKDLALLIDKRLAIVAEIDGELAGMCVALPNLNEAVRDLKGKLLPFGVPKLLWRLKVKGVKTGRLPLLGIKAKYRKQKRYGYLAMAMVAEIAERGRQGGYEWGELSWLLEDNTPVLLLVRAAGGKRYKTYRLYEGSV